MFKEDLLYYLLILISIDSSNSIPPKWWITFKFCSKKPIYTNFFAYSGVVDNLVDKWWTNGGQKNNRCRIDRLDRCFVFY